MMKITCFLLLVLLLLCLCINSFIHFNVNLTISSISFAVEIDLELAVILTHCLDRVQNLCGVVLGIVRDGVVTRHSP